MDEEIQTETYKFTLEQPEPCPRFSGPINPTHMAVVVRIGKAKNYDQRIHWGQNPAMYTVEKVKGATLVVDHPSYKPPEDHSPQETKQHSAYYHPPELHELRCPGETQGTSYRSSDDGRCSTVSRPRNKTMFVTERLEIEWGLDSAESKEQRHHERQSPSPTTTPRNAQFRFHSYPPSSSSRDFAFAISDSNSTRRVLNPSTTFAGAFARKPSLLS